jgi:serpin B
LKDSPVGPTISAAEKAVRQALDKPLTVHFTATPLSDAIHKLAKAASVSIVLDTREEVSKDVNSTATVTLDASGRTLRSILEELVRPLRLVWTYHDESLLITSAAESESDSMLSVRVYNLADFPAYQNRRGEGVPDYKNVIDTITTTIRPATWQDNGGCGSIAEYDKAGIHGIVVSQYWQTHLQIESLLDQLRKLRGPALTADDIKKLPLPPEPAESSGADQPPWHGESPGADQPPKPLEPDPRRDSLVAANNQFAFDLHRQLKDDNRFFSPSSVATALAMVYTGARGQTAEEIAKALHFTLPQDEVAPAFQALLATLPVANHPGCTFTAANRLWGRRGYGFLEPFVTTARDRFGGGIVEVDFGKPAAVCDLINAWADQKTAGTIKQIVTPDAIKPLLRLIVTNAIYFKGRWAESFEAAATKTGPFFSGVEQIDIPLMHQVARCRYGSFDNIKVLEKTYRGGEIAMMILLPEKDPEALSDLERSLSAEKVKEWLHKLASRRVDVTLPKFRLETNVPLMDALQSLGMARVFDSRKADLSGINGGKEPLWLDWILQRAYVDVDEEGTEAAAVTAAGLGGGISRAPRIPIFRADHPFVFLIRDTRTGCIFFLGRLVKPEK